MEVNDVLPISAQPVQEGQEVTRPNQESDDAVAFAALLYLILGTPQAGINSTEPEGMKAGETESSASGAMPIRKGSGALIVKSALNSSTRALAWAEGTGSGFSPSGVLESVTRLPGGGQAGLPVGLNVPTAVLANRFIPQPAEVAGAADGAAPNSMLTELRVSDAKLDGARTDGSPPKSAAVANASDASIGGGQAEPVGVSEINQDPIEAFTAQASAAGKGATVRNDGTSPIRKPASGSLIGVAADAVESEPQAEPDKPLAKLALAKGNVIGRDSVINVESFDHAQGRPGTRNIEQQATGGSVGRDYAINTEDPHPWKVAQPTTASATGQVAASGSLANQGEQEFFTKPAGENHLALRSVGQIKLDMTASVAASDSQVYPAQDSEKPVPGKSNAIQRSHKLGNDSINAEKNSVNEPAGEIYLGIERAGKFQVGKTADGGVAEQDARLMAEADPKTDAPRAGRGPAQRLSDIAAPVPRPDIAAEKFGPASDPASASWRSTVNRVADELASHVRLNKREAVIQLDPPELGKIKIEMRLDGEKLAARIVAEVHESRELIESHLQELRQALRVQHLDLTDVRVSQDPGSGSSGDPMQGFRQQQPDGEPQWARNSENSIVAASVSPERSGSEDSGGGIGRVSVWA